MNTPDDMKQAEQERDAAIEQGDVNADPEWKIRALNAVERLAKGVPALTTDDIWQSGLDSPRDGRAIGGVMRVAARKGLI